MELEPFNVYMNTQMGETYLIARQFDNALEKPQWATNMYPNNFLAHLHLGEVYRAKSMIEDAIMSFEKAVHLSGGVPLSVSRLVCALYENGEKKEAEQKMKSLENSKEMMCYHKKNKLD